MGERFYVDGSERRRKRDERDEARSRIDENRVGNETRRELNALRSGSTSEAVSTKRRIAYLLALFTCLEGCAEMADHSFAISNW